MQGSHFLMINRSGPQAVIVASGVVMRQINKDGTHFLCKTLKKGYSVNEVVPLQQLESLLLFERAEDMNAWLADNTPPPAVNTAPAVAPPVDNEHVAPGCEPFDDVLPGPTA